MMRATDDLRRVYKRNQVTHVCFAGLTFSPGKLCQINPEKEVKIAELEPDRGKKRILVSQRIGQKTIKETWKQAQIPTHSR
jgi:hypothetical protein